MFSTTRGVVQPTVDSGADHSSSPPPHPEGDSSPKVSQLGHDNVIVLNQTVSLRNVPQFELGEFREAEFDSRENWPTAGPNASKEEKAIVDLGMDLAYKHTLGMYKDVLIGYHKRGWISEHMVLFDPKTRVYLGKPDNLYDKTEEIAKQLTPNQNRLLNETWSLPNRVKNAPERFVLEDESFDHEHAKDILKPVVAYFADQKPEPQHLMLKGVEYPSPKTIYKTPGAQPNNRDMPAVFDKMFAYHAALSILKDGHHLAVDPEGREESQGRFEVDKSRGRRAQWQRKISSKAPHSVRNPKEPLINAGELKFTVPKYEPMLPNDAFEGISGLEDAEKFACLIDLENPEGKLPLQVLASVAIHPKSNRCFMEYKHYAFDPMPKKYAVSEGEPLFGDNPEALIGIYDDSSKALAVWSAIPSSYLGAIGSVTKSLLEGLSFIV
jgi:hypothetical protein